MTASPPPLPTHPPGLDAQALARLRELDPDGRHGVLQRVLVAFETSLTRMLVQLRGELDAYPHAQAPDVVATVAHTLKSSSMSVGALPLAQACSEVELKLRGGDTSALDRDISRLIQEGEAALAAVGTILRS